MIKYLSLLMGCIVVLPLHAISPNKPSDSLRCTVSSHKVPIHYPLESLIYPASAIVVGSVASGSGFGKKINRRVRRAIEHKKRPIRADDYLQYLPTVSVFGLSLTGARAKHDYLDRAVITTTSYLMMGIMVNTVKYTTRVQRPGRGSRNSFPSGHTATAFMGAELLRLEYGTWAGVAGYSLASAIGVARIYNGRHWVSDVLVGSGVGILSAHAGYYLHPLIRPLYRKDKRGMNDKKSKIPQEALTVMPYTTGTAGGLAMYFSF